MTDSAHRQAWRQVRRQRCWRIAGVMSAVVVVGVSLAMSGVFDLTWLVNVDRRLGVVAPTAWPPDAGRLFSHWLQPLGETLVMSIAGTALGVLGAIPLGVLAARGISPHRFIPLPVRALLSGMRTIPELLLALILVIVVGPGMVTGTLALAIHSAGMLGKFYHEAMEHAHPEPILVARSSGGGRLHTVLYGVLPQVMPNIVDVTMFRWECNLRAAVVLGIIGAGGIGQELLAAQRMLRYQEVIALVLVILVLVILVDCLSAWIRKRMG